MTFDAKDVAAMPPDIQEQIMKKLGVSIKANRNQPEDVKKESKYHNQEAIVTGLKFQSKHEAKRFMVLMSRQEAGEIEDLRLQVDFTLQEAYTTIKGLHVQAIRYRADFTYHEWDGVGRMFVVEDAKSPPTKKRRDYVMKRKLMQEKYGITIREV